MVSFRQALSQSSEYVISFIIFAISIGIIAVAALAAAAFSLLDYVYANHQYSLINISDSYCALELSR